ncbi:hypothetical protein [Solimonas marina]|uniref:DUF1161 domain-containing protein n=1 Tax=Solimonas marina TaxID=2714601 RepID=A0A970B8A4_9GAMM|nr:hypothetical protein [Solimonas marina]NKF24788.1 hypothetical protein [Solimonas marina]
MTRKTRYAVPFFVAASAVVCGAAWAAEANPADIQQADKFLAKLPPSCASSSKAVGADGAVTITIKCDGNGKKMNGVVSIKDGVVTKIE